MSTLFEGIHDGDVDAVVRALRSGEPAEADQDGETALYRAALADEPGIVRVLLAAGADPARGGGAEGGDLALCAAACGGHAEVARALLAAGARPDQEEAYGFTAMAWAVRLGHAETVRVLLEHGADPDRPGPDGLPPLVAAARRGSTSSVRALLDHGAAAREDALHEARRWIGVDVAGAVLRGLLDAYGSQPYEAVVRRVREDGGITVVVDLLRPDGTPGSGNEQQTGHAAIATLLETALGIRVPPEELAARALRCEDPELDDWTEAVAALAGRGDEETFRAAAAWCAADDGLRRALGASVLGSLEGFTAPSLAVLCRLAAETAKGVGAAGGTPAWDTAPGRVASPAGVGAAGRTPASDTAPGQVASPTGVGAAGRTPASDTAPGWVASPTADTADPVAPADPAGRGGREPALAVVTALGRVASPTADAAGPGGEPKGLAELSAFAAHPDAEVRRALATALTGLVPAGHAPALDILLALSRDHDSRVRDWATLALAEVPGDTPALREALAARLGDADPDVVAEAARGLAMRQDPRATEALAALLADGARDGTARETALAALEFVRDERVRNRLEWTSPRCR
ncbi:ankyrin repeat domain-containing protein [Streptomyces sp. NPDC008121]|uniref:ankyrin repeat domain-containing protein n=1 Tax=Streptomyces sp. NPDC008121 TaxID=3364809 RepID=UPI0036EE193D